MPQINDAMYAALRTQLYTGSVNDMLVQWLVANGATPGNITDMWVSFFRAYFGFDGEQVTNGYFINWTNDDPDSWGISPESEPDRMVTQDPNGARYYSTGGLITMAQVCMQTGVHGTLRVDIKEVNGGPIQLYVQATATVIMIIYEPGVHTKVFTPDATTLAVKRHDGAVITDTVIRSISYLTGSNFTYNDLATRYLIDKGFSGSLDDMWLQFWVAGGIV